MKVMVVGGGGREHAIIKELKKSPEIDKLYALPGNGGIARDAECVAIGAKDIDAIVEFAKANYIDYAVVAPDDPLVLGCVDALNAIGIECFGPNKAAAIIEAILKAMSSTLIFADLLPFAATYFSAILPRAKSDTTGIKLIQGLLKPSFFEIS